MQNIIPKNWSREALYSLVAIILAYTSWYALGNITFDTYGNTTFFVIEQGLFSLGWYYLFSDLWDWFPPIVSLVLVSYAFHTATLSIQKTTDDKSKKGRMFALVFASISGFVLVMAFLALLIAITSGDGMFLFSSHAVSMVFEILAVLFIAFSFYVGVKHLGKEKKETSILAFWILSGILLMLLVVSIVYSHFFPPIP